jgi:hypothetical protein
MSDDQIEFLYYEQMLSDLDALIRAPGLLSP